MEDQTGTDRDVPAHHGRGHPLPLPGHSNSHTMDEPGHRARRYTGMNPWRAGCVETRTSGSEGGPRKPTGREADRAPRSDPYTEHPTREGKAYCAVVLDGTRGGVGWSIDA